MSSFVYFAYGSNMLIERLRAKTRCPSAKRVGIGCVADISVRFTKRSTDQSGKATLVVDEGALAYGVLFEIDESETSNLDRAESHGYRPIPDFPVTDLRTGSTVIARTYFALPNYVDHSLRPYDWYRALVLAGALQNRLPSGYIDVLREIEARADPDAARATRIEALGALREAGFENLLKG